MEIRCAKISDSGRINELYEQLDKTHRVAHTDRFQEPSEHGRSIEYQNELITNPDIELAVAIINNEIIGFVEGRIMKSADYQVLRKRQWLQVNSLVVDKDFQCRGIGQELFDYLVAWGKSKEAESVELNVYSFNESAMAFYKKNDFHEIVKHMVKKL